MKYAGFTTFSTEQGDGILTVKRFAIADEQGLEHDIENQRKWNELVMDVQEIN